MIKNIALMLLAIVSTIDSRCTEGCLRCTLDNKCLYCDVLQDYKLLKGRCVKETTSNCVSTNEKNQCIRCEQNFYVDPVGFTCVELFEKIRVENCLYHLAPNKCSVCNEGYMLEDHKCAKISSPITNCAVENIRNECERCKAGYILSLDFKSCSKAPEISNCATVQHLECRSCKSNYLFNQNYYTDLIYGFKNSFQYRLLHEMRLAYSEGTMDTYKFSTCQKKNVENCIVFESNNRCRKCAEGYFVNKKQQCEAIPSPSLQNCLRYSSLTKCIECSPGYFLKSDTECVAVIPIQNCMLYKTNVDFSSCARCTDNFYLSAENLCTRRTDISNIDLCKMLSHEFEKCQICAKGYIPTSDGFRCLPEIDNCEKYAFTNTNSFYHTCTRCKLGFYYNQEDKICIKGNVDFCEEYDFDSPECVRCESKFYLNGQTCEPHIQLPFCSKYHLGTKNVCDDCDANSFLFQQENSCERVDRIPHCVKYENKTFCERCEDGYFSLTRTSCEMIPAELNCLQLDPQDLECEKCLPGFLIKDGLCVRPEAYLVGGCEKWENNGTTKFDEFRCKACSKNYVPVEFEDTFVCKDVRDLMQKQFGTESISIDANCAQYFEENNQFSCIQCKPGFYLVGKTCSQNCYEENNLTIYRQWVTIDNRDGDDKNESFRIEKSNVCEKTIPNCAVASLALRQDFVNIRYVCERCVSGYLPMIRKERDAVSRHAPQELDINLHMPLTSVYGVDCVKSQDWIVVGETGPGGEPLKNCELYQELFPGVLGCKTCSFSFTGTVSQLVRECKKFNQDETCKECNPMHYRKSAYECLPVKRIDHCVQYNGEAPVSTCVKCESQFFVDANKCTPRVNSLGKINCELQLNADVCTCVDGFIENPQNQKCERLPDDCKTAQLNQNIITCIECDKKISYLSNGVCEKGIVNQCEEYDQATGKCLVCKNGFFKDQAQATLCIAHSPDKDPNCSKWSQTVKDQCEECKVETTLFTKLNECRPVVNTITNCEEYFDEFSCSRCEKNYFLNNVSRRCLQIPAESNCLVMKVVDFSGQGSAVEDYLVNEKFLYTCDQCKPFYFRRLKQVSISKKNSPNEIHQIPVFECQDFLDYMRINCEESQSDGLQNMGNLGCQGCKQGYFPYEFIDKFICIDRKYLQERKNGFLQDPYCLKYEFVNNQMTCLQCKYPRFLNDGFCLETCPGTKKKYVGYISSDNTLWKNVCITPSAAINNCEIYVSAEGDDTMSPKSETCFKCAVDYSKVFVTTGTGTANFIKQTIFDMFNEQDTSLKVVGNTFAEIQCVKLSQKTVSGLVDTNNLIDNCELYSDIKPSVAGTIYGCLRCKFGYRGRVLFNTGEEAGYIEYCEKFDECDLTVKGGVFYSKELEARHGSFNSYLSCFACTGGKTLVSAWKVPATAVPMTLDQFQVEFDKTGANTYTVSAVAERDMNPLDIYNQMCIESTALYVEDQANAALKPKQLFFKNNGTPVANCGVVILNTTGTGDISNSFYCAACKPGYKPTAWTATKFVQTCEQIKDADNTNCTSSTVLNTCTSCIFKMDGLTKKIVKDANSVPSCLLDKGTTHCFAGYDSPLKCLICDPGYEVADDYTCYRLQLDDAGTRKFNFYNYFWENNSLLGELWRDFSFFAQNLDQIGELSCPESQVLYKITKDDENLDKTVCLIEKNAANANSPSNNYYLNGALAATYTIPNCERYGFVDGKHVCRACAAGNIITADYKCLDSTAAPNDTNLPNCVKAEKEDGAVCLECATNYINVGGFCRDKTNAADKYLDANCESYSSQTRSNYKGICAVCKTGYYTSNLIPPFNICKQIPPTATNCTDFLDNTGCIKCEAGYGLADVKEGENTVRRVCIKMRDNNNNEFLHDANCDQLVGIGDPDSLNHQKLKCQKCKAAFVLSNQFQKSLQRCYSVVPPIAECSAYDKDPATPIIQSTFRCTACANPSTHYLDLVNNTCTLRTVIANCDNYDTHSDRCLSCEESYKIKLDGSSCDALNTNNRSGYLEACRAEPTCDPRFQYEGLVDNLNAVFTCHKCQKESQIPFAVLELKQDENLPEYEVIKEYRQYLDNFTRWEVNSIEPANKLLQCYEPVKESFGITDALKFKFPDNCALGIVDLSKYDVANQTHDAAQSNVATNPDLSKTSVRCVTCKPKFKPTYANVTVNAKEFTVNLLVTACTAITNCESSTWFNACTQCEPGFAYSYGKQGILYDQCIAVSTNKNCLSYDPDRQMCVYCKRGTYLNRDGICEIINPPKCEDGQFRYRGAFEQKDLEKGLYHTNQTVGCHRCQKGFVPVRMQKHQKVCTHSLYHVANAFVTNTEYIPNCESYGLDPLGSLLCERCKDGYVQSPVIVGECIINTQLTGCELALSASVCLKCKKDYVLADSKCELETITNCVEFGNNQLKKECPHCSNNQQKCTRCAPEYYLAENKCTLGEVPQCEIMETKNICNKCKPGFALVQGKSGASFCYPIDKRFNCARFNEKKLQIGVLECEECKDSFHILSISKTDMKFNSCMPFAFVQGCVRYANNPIAIADSSFFCVECMRKAYLSNGTCVDRTAMPDECVQYDINKDQCLKCQNGYYISTDGKACVAYPQGLYGCMIYQSETVCAQCQSKFVLKDEKCISVEVEIPNCKYYEDESFCLECEVGFVNIKGLCEKPYAKNCATYQNSTNCASCQSGFHLEIDVDGNTNCIASAIQNCIVYNEVEPYDCLDCSTDFYVQDGVCVAVGDKIEGCVKYKEQKVCERCSSEYALQYDGSICLKTPEVVSQIDLNCDDSKLNDTLTCNTCDPGYYFVYNQCVACPQEVMASGCFNCDPKKPTRCLLCQTGYIQSPEGECIKPVIESSGVKAGIDFDSILTR